MTFLLSRREEKTKRVEEIRTEFESFCMEIAREIFRGNKTSLEVKYIELHSILCV